MVLSKTAIVFVLTVFFLTTVTLTTAIGIYYNEDTGIQQTDINNTGFFPKIFKGFITGFTILPVWINTILYGSLTVMSLFLLLSSLPTFSGGS